MEQAARLNLLHSLSRFWGNLTGIQRFVTIVFGSTSLVALLFVSMLASKPQKAVLFSGLESEDAGAVVAKLQEKKVPYEIDGTSIKIPEKQVAEIRMDLANQGLPKGGTVGFELFDKTSFGMTEFSEQMNYQRALQGELVRSIDELEGVQSSRVHIAMPERSVFLEHDTEPSASVMLKLRPGVNLSSEQVSGIVHLVSTSVRGLKPGGVTIVDTNGNELSSPDAGDGMDPRMSASQLTLRRTHERQMEKDIQSMLERVLGPRKAVVRVNARINFDQVEQNSETYEPLNPDGSQGVLSSHVQMRETYDRDGDSGPVTSAAVSSGRKGYDRLESTSKYEVSRTTQRVVKAPGQIEKISVAVMVDDDVDPASRLAISNAVTMAAGIDLKRGDQIRVESLRFDNSIEEADSREMHSMAAQDTWMSWAKLAGAFLLLVLVMFFIKGMFSRVTAGGYLSPQIQELPVGSATSLRASEAYAGVKGRNGEAHIVDEIVSPSLDAEPEEVAQIVRAWLAES